ncbi:MAG: hypothetical protein K6G42_11055 [Lachnospiraceae bacterium]|nr:hypothetical protein [Lachnospiraceae bacterium]
MVIASGNCMAVYFSDSEYLENFLGYLAERNTGFICRGFTNPGSLAEYAAKEKIAVLLTDAEGLENGAGHINTDLTVVLTERPDVDTLPDVYAINILQPVDEIIREILKVVAKRDISVSKGFSDSEGYIYTFFSPVGRCLTTTLAMTAAQLLAERSETVYLNLEADSGFSVIYQQEYDADLSDLLFYLKDGIGERAALMLQGTVCRSQGVSYVPPVTNPEDLLRISSDEVRSLFSLLFGSGFKNIILDMGEILPGFLDILSMSDRIYMPVRGDAMSKAKEGQLLSYFRTLEDFGAEERIVKLEPPYFKGIRKITENLRGTDVGRYMAGYLDYHHA